MNKQAQAISDDMSQLAEDARAFMVATADVAGDKVADTRKQLTTSLVKSKEIYGRVRDKVAEGARAVDDAVHEHPYQAMGIALGIGAIIGYVAARCCLRNRE
jgi:ElaB/YqjD/DUF883 family membrane-anchored ribosome-binding protein